MAFNFVSDGDRCDLVAPYPVVAGQGMQVGTLFSVALHPAGGATSVGAAAAGIWDLTKEPSLAIAAGARVFWDNANRRVTTATTGNVSIGHATVAALGAASIVRVRLGASTPAGV